VQFHPTAIATGADPMPLATEALRGEGAILVNGRGERFMAGVPAAELAPRDVVARAIEAQIAAGEAVFLDTRAAIGERILARFPAVAALCRAAGIDPVSDSIPVRPAAHYHMGGIAVDARGRSTLEGLWACGEAACTGLHGANRLASNSLLEALAYARWIARDIRGLQARAAPAAGMVAAGGSAMPAGDAATVREIRQLMTRDVGVIRSDAGLRRAMARLAALLEGRPARSPVAEMALVGLVVATAARARRESRGAQFRADFPQPAAGRAQHSEFTLDAVRRAVTSAADLAPAPERAARAELTQGA
jgi:aspartate oxidase